VRMAVDMPVGENSRSEKYLANYLYFTLLHEYID